MNWGSDEFGQRLNLIADFGIGGKVAGTEAVFDAELAGGFPFGGEVSGSVSKPWMLTMGRIRFDCKASPRSPAP
jgi:hypothetical protein